MENTVSERLCGMANEIATNSEGLIRETNRLLSLILEMNGDVSQANTAVESATADPIKENAMQMGLTTFSQMYAISKSTFERLVHRAKYPMPAYKIGGKWVVDIAEYKKWRTEEDKRCRNW